MNAQEIAALVDEINSFTPCLIDSDVTRQYALIEAICMEFDARFNREQQEKLREALLFSAKAHTGIRRADKEMPYFLHPLEVVCTLFYFGVFDYKTIIAAILHDVIEDTDKKLIEIRKKFGFGVSRIVRLVTKYPNRKHENIWSNLSKEKNFHYRWRAIVLKFCDRIHNMETLDALPREKRVVKIKETKNEFPKLAKILETTLIRFYRENIFKNKNYNMLPYKLMARLMESIHKYD